MVKKRERMTEEELRILHLQQKYPKFKIQKTLVDGQILNPMNYQKEKINQIRTHTFMAICQTPCLFVTINRQYILKVIQAFYDDKNASKIKFLSQFSLFKNLPKLKLNTFIDYFEEQKYTKDQILYSEGD